LKINHYPKKIHVIIRDPTANQVLVIGRRKFSNDKNPVNPV